MQTQAEAGGAQRISQQLTHLLVARGHDVRTAFLYRKTPVFDEDSRADILVETPPTNSLQRLSAAASLLPYLASQRPDAIITFQHFGNIVGTIAGRLSGCRKIIANQNGLPGYVGKNWIDWVDRVLGAIGLYSANVVNSAWTGQQFSDYPASYRARLVHIPHGVSVGAVPQLTKAEARRRWGLPPSGLIGLSAGRMAAEKRQSALIPLLKALPHLTIAIAGDGPLRSQLTRDATEHRVEDRLHLLGEVAPESMGSFLSAGDLFLFPSAWETFGLAAVEAAANGLPVLASDLPVLRETLGTAIGKISWFVDFNNTDSAASALSDILGTSNDTMSSAAAELRSRYSPASMAEAYLRLCQ